VEIKPGFTEIAGGPTGGRSPAASIRDALPLARNGEGGTRRPGVALPASATTIEAKIEELQLMGVKSPRA
jgi:hypothetical protein